MNPKNDNWIDTYIAQFGRNLSQSEAQGWTNEIRAAFDGPKKPWPGETARAIRALAATWPTDDGKGGRNPFPPSCRDIISAMKAERRKAHAQEGAHIVLSQVRSSLPNGGDYLRTACHHENTGDWQREVRDADPHERWTIICRPASNDQCAEREAYCRKSGLAVHRFVPNAGELAHAFAGVAS